MVATCDAMLKRVLDRAVKWSNVITTEDMEAIKGSINTDGQIEDGADLTKMMEMKIGGLVSLGAMLLTTMQIKKLVESEEGKEIRETLSSMDGKIEQQTESLSNVISESELEEARKIVHFGEDQSKGMNTIFALASLGALNLIRYKFVHGQK